MIRYRRIKGEETDAPGRRHRARQRGLSITVGNGKSVPLDPVRAARTGLKYTSVRGTCRFRANHQFVYAGKGICDLILSAFRRYGVRIAV